MSVLGAAARSQGGVVLQIIINLNACPAMLTVDWECVWLARLEENVKGIHSFFTKFKIHHHALAG